MSTDIELLYKRLDDALHALGYASNIGRFALPTPEHPVLRLNPKGGLAPPATA